MMGEWFAYNQKPIDGGHWISGASLAPTTTATTIHKSYDGEPTLTDGPYAKTKEQLGGYYLISAKDLDEAIALATAIPIPVGSFESAPLPSVRTPHSKRTAREASSEWICGLRTMV